MRTNFNISLSQTENVLLKGNTALKNTNSFWNRSGLLGAVISLSPPTLGLLRSSPLPCCLCPTHGLVLGLVFLLLADTLSLSSSFTPVDSTTPRKAAG